MTVHNGGRNDREVVVTGLGVVSPYGRSCQAYWQGLSQGLCVIKSLRIFPTDGFRSRIAAEVDAETVRTLGVAARSRASRFVVAAVQEALGSAGLSREELSGAAVSIGGAGGGMLEAEAWYWGCYSMPEDVRQRGALRTMLP